jgi:mersacidin/lichenicidin family type 2 lantibiotic
MKKKLIAQAWKDPRYRATLSAEQRAALPECPSGTPLTELSQSELAEISGGLRPSQPQSCIGVYCPTDISL